MKLFDLHRVTVGNSLMLIINCFVNQVGNIVVHEELVMEFLPARQETI